MKNLKSLTLGQIVSADHRAAAILEKYNLDFCCHGNQNFDEVCTAANLNTQDIIKEIENLEPNESLVEFTEWPLDQLADYIFSAIIITSRKSPQL